MPRKPLIRCSRFPYHIVTRSRNKEWFPLEMPRVWQIALDALVIANKKHPVELISFVLMSNHYHMILRTPDENLDEFMYEFNKNFSLGFRRSAQVINQVFGSRYKWCLIQSQRYFMNCYRYVYQNPLRAGIVQKCEDYPYSTLHFVKKAKTFPIQVFDHFGFKDEYGLHWLNQKIEDDELYAVRNGLRKSELTVLKNRATRKQL